MTSVRTRTKTEQKVPSAASLMCGVCVRVCVLFVWCACVFYLCGVRLCVKVFHPHVCFEFQVPERVCHVEQRCVYARMHIYR